MRVIRQRVAHLVVQIAADLARVLHKVQIVEQFQVGHPGGGTDGVGRIGPAVADGAVFIGALLQHFPHFVADDRARQRCIG